MPTPYNPGKTRKRDYSPNSYQPYQEMRWQAYNIAYYALYAGRLDTLHPTPGFWYHRREFEEWQEKFVAGGKAENASRGMGITRHIDIDDYPHHVWVWIYQRMLAADELVPR